MMPILLNQQFDSVEFRGCLSEFATGVTVVSTMNSLGKPIGLTANSFVSVSLKPALVSWCLSMSSFNREVFDDAEYFSINILSKQQADLALQFASKVDDRFAGVAWQPGVHGMPLIAGCAAWFECRRKHIHVEGDHLLYIGEVLGLGRNTQAPLLFHHGKIVTALS